MEKQTTSSIQEVYYKKNPNKTYLKEVEIFNTKYLELATHYQKMYPLLNVPKAYLCEEPPALCYGMYSSSAKIIIVDLNSYLCYPQKLESTIFHELTHAYLHQQGIEDSNQWHGHLFWSTFKPLNKYLLAADKYRERFRQKMEELKNGQIDYTDRDLRIREINIPKQITRRGGNLSGRHS